jgi:hypothetical protein
MKRIFVSLSLLLTVGLSSAFAADKTNVDQQVKESFKKEFSGASYVEWNEIGDYFKATFIIGGHRAEAYFTKEGELAGSARDLFYDQLPLAVMTSLDKRYASAEVMDVREINNAEGTTYHVTFRVQGKQVKVKTDTGGNILTTEKSK